MEIDKVKAAKDAKRAVRAHMKKSGETFAELGKRAKMNPVTLSLIARGEKEYLQTATIRRLAKVVNMKGPTNGSARTTKKVQRRIPTTPSVDTESELKDIQNLISPDERTSIRISVGKVTIEIKTAE